MLMEILCEEDCKVILNNYVNTNTPIRLLGFKVNKYSEDVMGYLGEHLKLIIDYTINNPTKIDQASFFLKTLPQFNINQNKFVQEMDVFSKELSLYQNIFSELSKLVSRPFCSKCYFSSSEKSVIVLEDLTKRGFQMSKRSYLNFEQCQSLMGTLGRFHAASIIYEECSNMNEFRINEHFMNETRESTFSFNLGHPRQKWCVTVTECLINCIKLLLPSNYANQEIIVNNLRKIVFQDMPEFIKPSGIFRNVITHDDLHARNFLFNDSDCLLVDFQLTRYTPPAMDVLTALYLNLERNFREENMDKFVNIYYSSFSQEINNFNMNIEKLLPKAEFFRSLEYYKGPALLESAMYATNVYLPDELSKIVVSDIDSFNEFIFINRSKYVVKEIQENLDFRNKINNVLFPLIEYLQDCSSA